MNGNAKVAQKDVLKLVERLLKCFGQWDSTLYSDVVRLQK
jgi:hypothetical protein